MKHHHARGPEETVCDLPPVVPAEPASGTPPTCLREAGMPDHAPAEDASQLAPPEPRLRHRLADRPTVMSRALDPHSPLLDGVGYGTWRAFFEFPESAIDPDRRIEVLAFMLVRAYSSLESEAADLAVRCFGPVHEKASRARLTDFAWRMLSDDLPVLPHYQNWDVCERLRRGLIQNFIIHRWPVRLFFLASRDPITFDRLLESCSSVSGGSDFIDSLERSASGHDSNASLGQREAIKKKQSWLSWLL